MTDLREAESGEGASGEEEVAYPILDRDPSDETSLHQAKYVQML